MMHEIDKEKFGGFITQLRKGKGMTQKELADRLYVSDKAVSKWETGTHLPDIALLTPLAELLGVTVAELLQGQPMDAETVQKEDVDDLLRQALSMNEQEMVGRLVKRKGRVVVFMMCAILGAFQLSVLHHGAGFTLDKMTTPLTMFVIGAALGAYFVFLAEDRIPAYYDQNAISVYAKGPVRMNLPGVHFNNSNWPYITAFIRKWCYGAMLIAAGLFYLADRLMPATAGAAGLLMVFLGSFLIPLCIIGKKYE